MTNFESDIESLSESFSTPDSESGEEYDFKPDLEIKDVLLAPLKPRDSVFFSFSQLSASVPLSSSISELS